MAINASSRRLHMSNQRAYRRIKITEILAAAVIPFLAALGLAHTSIVTAGLGVLITVLEGLLHLTSTSRIGSTQEHAKWASVQQQEPGKQQKE